jgi:hypothetical protein
MDPELLQMLMLGGGGGFPAPMVPPPGMLSPPTAVQGFGDAAALTQAPVVPPMRPVEPYMTDPLAAGTPAAVPPPTGVVPPVPTPTTLGAALEPSVPMPQPRPAGAPGATPSMNGVAAKSLTDTLRGVIPPAPPQAQKVSTPHAAPMAKLQSGNVADLLASLGIGPQQAFPGLKLPSTLGQALGGR